MKPGRNDPCPCGSGKKYKRCCLSVASKAHAEVFDEVEQIAAMNPHLTLDELNIVLQHRMQERNNLSNPDFCGLSPTQMANWLYAPFDELEWVTIRTPADLSSSPVMRYLTLILDEAMKNDGSFKATSKGNLPTKLVRQASGLLPEFAVAKYDTPISINDYAGANEDKFDALHYTRVLAEIAGIIYRRSGSYHVKKSAQKQYLNKGVHAFFKPMLEAATYQYNWGYFDSWEQEVNLRTFWLFMLWRLQTHASVDQLVDEVAIAFPALLQEIRPSEYCTSMQMLGMLVKSRFIDRFLQFWGFVTVESKMYFVDETEPRKVELQPMLAETFQFSIKH